MIVTSMGDYDSETSCKMLMIIKSNSAHDVEMIYIMIIKGDSGHDD